MPNLAAIPMMQEAASDQPAKDLYHALSATQHDAAVEAQATDYLCQTLGDARHMPNELPDNLAELEDWMLKRAAAVGEEYRQYLDARKAGAPRRLFSNRAHALYFLQSVAPTKLVDGAWLYGMLPRWADADYLPLIRTYLEELGDGVPGQNHVVLYKKLLATHGCDQWQQLSDAHFVQGTIQLCLGNQAEHFLPEVIGYNLGYEQLPLHLLITAYELNELGIDPYYFTLHVTIDNAATGHAHKALQSIRQLIPLVGDADTFYRRMTEGYRLNDLGANTMSVIASFDIEAEIINVLRAKAAVGQNMHSDYCRVAGRTVNDWLSQPSQIPAFLDALTQAGWIRRGEPAENSRFWRLIHGERSEMFGVFNEYEQQLLRDWIALPADSWTDGDVSTVPSTTARVTSFRGRQRAIASNGASGVAPQLQRIGRPRSVIRIKHESDESDDFTAELRAFEQQIADLPDRAEAMRTLIGFMSPSLHHTRAGLMATRIYSKLLQ